MTAKEKVFYFWGVMDAVGAVYYSYGSWEFLGGNWVLATVNLGMIFYLAMFGGVDEMLKGTYYLIYTLTPLTLILSFWFFFKKKILCPRVRHGTGDFSHYCLTMLITSSPHDSEWIRMEWVNNKYLHSCFF